MTRHRSFAFLLGVGCAVFLCPLAGPAADPSPLPDGMAGAKAEAWKGLLDEKLSAWEVWMGVPHQTVTGLPEGTPTSPDGHKGTPLGLGNDPKQVFSVRMEKGEPVLCISGEIFGGLTSRATYADFHFRTEFKWGERKWEPKLQAVRDNGILYHCTGPHGVFWNAWKRSLEFQVEEQNMGDLYLLGGTHAEAAVTRGPKGWAYDPGAEVKPLHDGSEVGTKAAHVTGDFEQAHGEWNTLEIFTHGRDAMHVVNGHVVLVIHRAGTVQGPEHTVSPLGAGQLQIQSEGAEAFYRRMEIRPITDYPNEIKQLAPPLAGGAAGSSQGTR